MKDKTITISLFGILISLFIFYFIILNNLFLKDYPMETYMKTLITKVGEEKWDEAQEEMDKINQSWNKLHNMLSLNYAEADYSMFIEFLSRLESDIKENETAQAASDASAALRIWDNFIKVVPQP